MRAYSVLKGCLILAGGVVVATNLSAATSSNERVLGPTQTVNSRPSAFDRLSGAQYEANRVGGMQVPSAGSADRPAFGYAVLDRPHAKP